MDSVSTTTKRYSLSLFFKELLYGFVTEYETPKIVTIHSYTMTTLLRVLQIILLLYSLFYLLLYEKGYQKQDSSIISSVTLKVKGISYIQTANNESYIFDGTDYIIPPSENNAIFIMTNFIQTEQVRSRCAENPSVTQALCTADSDCQNKPRLPNINGRWTGRCILSSKRNDFYYLKQTTNQTTGLCEIQGWCPVENDAEETTFIKEVVNFTIFIKNFIEFPLFQVKHKNMVDNLRSCVFDPITDQDCPIFRLDYILQEAERDVTERELMLRLGGVIRVKIDWDCNLDRDIKKCKPMYSFARLDTKFQEETFSVGFNFRFASHWKHHRKYLRSLTKAFGLRFIICVSGKAGKFDFITLTLNTGSLVGIFGLATFFCDIILLNLTKKASVYRDFVYQRVKVNDPGDDQSFQNAQELMDMRATIYTNPCADHRTTSLPIWTSERSENYSDSSSAMVRFNIHSSDELPRLQPRLGLTNMLK